MSDSVSSQTTTTYQSKVIGPRVVGGRYRSAYWGTEYTVLAIDTSATTPTFTVQDDHGIRTHSTAWAKRDEVLS